MELTDGKIGGEAAYSMKVESGKVVLSVMYDGKGMDGALNVMLDSEYFIDKLAEAIPGKIDDAVLGLLKAALKG